MQKQAVKGIAIYHNIAIIKMPLTKVIFFKDKKGGCPVLEWLEGLPRKVEAKAWFRIEQLEQLGHELWRPPVDYLRDGIYELRWRGQSVNYRILYFFYGKSVVVLSHGLTKEGVVPDNEIDRALKNKDQFQKNPFLHSRS